MLVIGLILSMFAIGLFCWLIFTLAVYALPFFRRAYRRDGRLSRRRGPAVSGVVRVGPALAGPWLHAER